MLKMKKTMAALAAVIMLLAACGTAPAEQDARKINTAADADEWVAAFLGDHPEEMEGAWAMTPMMEAAVAQTGGIGGFAKQIGTLGTVVEISPAYEGKLQGYQTFQVPCVFSAMSVDLVLVIQDGAIAGLQIGAYSGGAREGKAEAEEFDSIDLALPVPSLGELPGILTMPKGDGPFPAVVLLHGSGPSDRDESIGSVKPFRDIAEGLARQGIAVYRFDKRTYAYGAALMGKTDFTPEDEYLEDAVNAVQLLAEQEKIDPDRIFVLGHSLGGNMIPAAARKLEQASVNACGFIMMAASPRPLDVLLREQQEFLDSLQTEITPEMQAERDALYAELDRLQDLESIPEDEAVAGAFPAYWKWLAAYDILQAAEEIRQPVLILQGEEDYQVTTEDFEIWRETFADRENRRMISYPGLTHVFVPGEKQEGPASYFRDGSVREDVITDIAIFIKGE